MATQSETIQVSGMRCERCVGRLAGALRGDEGLEFANANLMGQVQLAWDDELTDRDALLAAMAKAGFRPLEPVCSLSCESEGLICRPRGPDDSWCLSIFARRSAAGSRPSWCSSHSSVPSGSSGSSSGGRVSTSP